MVSWESASVLQFRHRLHENENIHSELYVWKKPHPVKKLLFWAHKKAQLCVVRALSFIFKYHAPF